MIGLSTGEGQQKKNCAGPLFCTACAKQEKKTRRKPSLIATPFLSQEKKKMATMNDNVCFHIDEDPEGLKDHYIWLKHEVSKDASLALDIFHDRVNITDLQFAAVRLKRILALSKTTWKQQDKLNFVRNNFGDICVCREKYGNKIAVEVGVPIGCFLNGIVQWPSLESVVCIKYTRHSPSKHDCTKSLVYYRLDI